MHPKLAKQQLDQRRYRTQIQLLSLVLLVPVLSVVSLVVKPAISKQLVPTRIAVVSSIKTSILMKNQSTILMRQSHRMRKKHSLYYLAHQRNPGCIRICFDQHVRSMGKSANSLLIREVAPTSSHQWQLRSWT